MILLRNYLNPERYIMREWGGTAYLSFSLLAHEGAGSQLDRAWVEPHPRNFHRVMVAIQSLAVAQRQVHELEEVPRRWKGWPLCAPWKMWGGTCLVWLGAFADHGLFVVSQLCKLLTTDEILNFLHQRYPHEWPPHNQGRTVCSPLWIHWLSYHFFLI